MSLVSVVTPTYNMGCMIEQAMSSVKHQTHRPLEHVIVDDGSTDDTVERVESFEPEDVTVRLVRLKSNRGAGTASSIGFSEAMGEYISFLAADDVILEPGKTTKQVESMRREGASWSYYRDVYSGADIGHMFLRKPSYAPMLRSMNWYFEGNPHRRLIALLFRNPINFSSVMIEKQCINNYGQIDPFTGNVDGDADLLMRYAALRLKVKVLSGAPIFYRDHPRQVSKNTSLMIRGAELVRLRLLTILEDADKLLERVQKSTIFLSTWLLDKRLLIYPATHKYLCDFILKNKRSLSWVLVGAAAKASKAVGRLVTASRTYQQELSYRVQNALVTDEAIRFRTLLQEIP